MLSFTKSHIPRDLSVDMLPEPSQPIAHEIISTLDALELPKSEYIVIGSAALWLSGVIKPRTPHDIDLRISSSLMESFLSHKKTPSGVTVSDAFVYDYGRFNTPEYLAPGRMSIDYFYRRDRAGNIGGTPYNWIEGHRVETLEASLSSLRKLERRGSGPKVSEQIEAIRSYLSSKEL